MDKAREDENYQLSHLLALGPKKYFQASRLDQYLEQGATDTSVDYFKICRQGQKAAAEFLALGGEIDQTTKTGRTLLMDAALYDCPEYVLWLLKNKANPNAQEIDQGQTPLLAAVSKSGVVTETYDVVESLIRAGAKADQAGYIGRNEKRSPNPLSPTQVVDYVVNLLQGQIQDADSARMGFSKEQLPIWLDIQKRLNSAPSPTP